jgi:ATP-dependent exoDNAse (exonuclease V) alpha subunit
VAGDGKRNRRKRVNDLPDVVQIAIGMKVMVTSNIETDLDVTNGARGEIVDIILHPDEPPLGDDPIVTLQHLPSYILVKLKQTRAERLEGLDEGVIPVEVATRSFQIKVRTSNSKYTTRSVRRRQFPMTAAYGFTDYRSQGQTLPYVIIDIASPPTGGLDLFNLYVALSRSSGRSSIRLLRDFEDKLFLKSHDVALLAEDDRLEKLDKVTKEWWLKMGRDRRHN